MLSGLLAFSIGLGNPSGMLPATAQESTPTIYVVQPGDSLASIALRYGLTTTELAQANGVINPNLIYVGLKLNIPALLEEALTAAPAGKPAKVVNRLHTVQASETLFSIALKYGTTVPSLIETNRLDRSGFIVPGQELIIPADARSNEAGVAQPTTPLPAPFTKIDIGQLPLVQGSLMEITVRTAQPVSVTGQFSNTAILFASEDDQYVGFAAISANPVTGFSPGMYTVVVTATQDNQLPTRVVSNVEIQPGHFNYENIQLAADRQDLLDPVLVAAEREKLSATWNNFTPVRYWNGLFRVPVDHYTRISSPYGTRRSYDGGPLTSYHEGTDFAVPAGTPVYAAADGVVMVAEPLAVRGNAIVIDHGWGLYSGYWHLSEFKVTPGQHVKQGDLIALSGDTGRSTGAHLHWDMTLRGVNVDPIQFTQEVFP
jgi:murein DD-endopeptidase MepM/ murein hydrolase activator NlpD